nr:HepT-like ribonuclease domain-containing protein [Demequina sp. TTPB684]
MAVLKSHAASAGAEETLQFDAICMRLAAAIEDASRIGETARLRVFGAKWPAMWSTRNRITHGYAFVSRDVIAATVERDLDDFGAGLSRIVNGSETAPGHR